MKKINYLLLGATGLLLASCSQEETLPGNLAGGDAVTFTVTLPDTYGTRDGGASVNAFGTGEVAKVLYFAAYDVEGSEVIAQSQERFPANSLTTTVSLSLAKGKTYQVVFFAQSEASLASEGEDGESTQAVYTFSAENKTVTVNYGAMTSANNLADAYDCFYGSVTTAPVGTTAENQGVELKRIVGQVNWGTNDITTSAGNENAYGEEGQYIQSSLQVAAYTTFDLISGDVVKDETEPVTATLADFGAPYNLPFPEIMGTSEDDDTTTGDDDATEDVTYTYVAMQYLLAPKDGTNYDLYLTINNGLNTAATEISSLVSVANVPVQANYQTNIYGNLLTDDVEVTVTKNPEWNTPSYDLPQGQTMPELVDGVYQIENESNLAWLAENINNGTFSSHKTSYTLTQDIYLTQPFTPIGTTSYPFQGNFDGNNHTIYNLNIDSSSTYVGLFGVSTYQREPNDTREPNTIQNLNIVNATVNGGNSVGILVGSAGNTNISNINISGLIKVSGTNYVGGLVGGSNNVNTVTGVGKYDKITINGEEGSYIQGTSYVGGILGESQGPNASYSSLARTISNSSSNVPVTGASYVGGIVGLAGYGLNVTNCTVGTAPESEDTMTVEDNSEPTISATSTSTTGYFIGGIVGAWQSRRNASNNTSYNTVISGCNFYGTLSSGATEDTSINVICGPNIINVSADNLLGTLTIDGQDVSSKHLYPTQPVVDDSEEGDD